MDIRREILRNVILCQALEPLAQKPGLSSRQDSLAGAKLESFIVAGVNSSWSFFDLADRILRHGRQPECIYDLAYEALSASGRNRLGTSTVNYGRILLLVPLVAAQVLEHLDTKSQGDVGSLLARTGEVLRNTTKRDVEYVERFIRLGYELSARHRERIGGAPRTSSPPDLERYATVWEAACERQQIYIVREFYQGYPNSLQVYRYLLHNLEDGLLQGGAMMYRVLLNEIQRADAVEDIIVTGLYLALTSHPESMLFP
jgi:triphosphoribosyl-dephospho-CoA synthetase